MITIDSIICHCKGTVLKYSLCIIVIITSIQQLSFGKVSNIKSLFFVHI